MMIIGCDYHPAFQQFALWIPTPENCASGDCGTARKRRSSTVQSNTE